MPVHDWTRVNAGVFHHFHQRWIGWLSDALNSGLLPPDLYALSEQIAGGIGPDVLTLQSQTLGTPGNELDVARLGGTALAVKTCPPKVRFVARTEVDQYALEQSSVVIRHSSEDRIVALIEIVSPGNKASRHALAGFLTKAVAALTKGYHLMILDLFPPGPRDPQGLHGLVWDEVSIGGWRQPEGEPLTVVSYDADRPPTAYVEPLAVGHVLPEMPLFLLPEFYIPVPLEETYRRAWEGVPPRWRNVVEGSGA